MTEEQRPVPAPDPGYAGADFDRYFDEAARSPLLGEMFREHFDSTDPGEVQGFNYVPMTGLERIAELLSGSGDGLLLDAACGRGGPGIWLARRIGRPLHGVDISRVAIEQARGLAVRQGARATFSEGTLNDTRLDDAGYPALVCLDALHFAADPAAAARELRRVAQPGGLLVVTTWQTENGPPRLRRDIHATLQEAGWSILSVEDHPDWLAAQLRLYEAALAAASWKDPAVQRLRDEGEAVASAIRGGRRLLIQARRS